MKRINIKAVFLPILLIIVLALTACQKDKKEDLNIDKETLHGHITGILDHVTGSSSDEALAVLKEMDKADLDMALKQYKLPFTAEAFLSGIDGYRQILDETGNYVETKDIDFDSDKDKIHAAMTCEFEKREVKVNIILNKKGMMETISFAPKYSFGEIAQKAGMNTMIGMGTVFIILAFIAFIISLFKFIPNSENKKKEQAIQQVEVKTASAVKEDDKELIAVITAAIVEYENLPNADGFVVREIVRRTDNRW